MEALDPFKRPRFCNILHAVAHNIDKGLSASQAAATDWHWMTWSEFCRDVALDPLRFPYRDSVFILNIFVRQYQTGSLSLSGRQVRSRMVKDVVRSIGQALATIGSPYPCLTSKAS